MNRNGKILVGISILALGIFLYIAYGTDLLRFYSNASAANEPNLPKGSRVIVSFLTKPKRLDFVCYKYTDSFFGNNKKIHRLAGIPNDTLQIKDGILFVNGKNLDSTLNLAFPYKVHKKTSKKLVKNKEYIPLYDDLPFYNSKNDSVIVFLNNHIAKVNNLKKFKIKIPKSQVDPNIRNQFKANWNIDHFGPLILGDKEYFVLGDSRHNSEDSRYTGVIDESKIIGRAILF